MYTTCMTKELSMIRVDKELKGFLKELAKGEGRTLEWMLDDALTYYAMNFSEIQAKQRKDANEVRNHIVAEGIELGILPDRGRDSAGNYLPLAEPTITPPEDAA